MTINTSIALISINKSWNILLNILHNLCIPILVSKENKVIDISLLPIILLIIFIL